MQLLDIDTITRRSDTTGYSGLTLLEETQARFSGISETLTLRTIEPG